MTKTTEIKILINQVIANTVAGLKTVEFVPYKTIDTSRRSLSITLGKVVQKFYPAAKEVKVYVERVYERKRRDYFTTVTVEIDKKAELFTPLTFTNYVIAKM